MKILTKEELQAVKVAAQSVAKTGSRKEAKEMLIALIKGNKGKAIEVSSEDVKPHFPEGFTEGLLMELADEQKIKVLLPKATKIKVTRKGEEREVPRYLSAVLEC